MQSSKRKSPKRKSPKRKSSKRKSPKNTKVNWVVYTRPGCPYCIDAKKLLKTKKQKITSITVTSKNRDMLLKKTKNYQSVPAVFYKGRFIGGFDQLERKLKTF